MKFLKFLAIATVMLVLGAGIASSQTWAPLNHQPGVNVGPMLQLRDGRILFHEEQDGNPRNWWILTPDSTGSYLNGTWSSGGQLPENYAPFYFSTQVLLDGKRVIVEGGEYNFGSAVWTNLGAVGTSAGATFTWALNSPPGGWANIGDAQSVILANGSYMQANCCTRQQALGPFSWVPTGTGKADLNDEEGWTLLPSGKVLTVDAYVFSTNDCGGNTASELYNPTTGTWTCGPNTPTQMWDSSGHELGPAVLMYNGKVLQFGAVPVTAIYDPLAGGNGSWTAGPPPAGGLDAADAPAALEPNGKVLAMLSPGEFQSGCQMVEYNPITNVISNTANPANCPSDSSFVGHLMVLPTGQIMFTDLSGRVEIYTPVPGFASGVRKPLILSAHTNHPMLSTNNVLGGLYFNGLTQNNGYGDDYQGDTDYPLVRLTSYSTGQVYYGITHDESTHSIDPNSGLMSTMFDRPAGLPTGNYKTEVVANGITSSNYVVFFAP